MEEDLVDYTSDPFEGVSISTTSPLHLPLASASLAQTFPSSSTGGHRFSMCPNLLFHRTLSLDYPLSLESPPSSLLEHIPPFYELPPPSLNPLSPTSVHFISSCLQSSAPSVHFDGVFIIAPPSSISPEPSYQPTESFISSALS